MQHTLEQFFRALRAADVRVSPAEAIDASRAVTVTGYADRTLFKDALCSTLAKSADEVGRFDAVFDTFFARDAVSMPPPSASPQGEPSDADMAATESSPLAQAVLSGDNARIQQAMEEAAGRAGVADIRLTTQRSRLTRRLLEEMGLEEIERIIANARRFPEQQGLADRLDQARRDLFTEAQAYVARQHDLYAAASAQALREERLARKQLNADGGVDPVDYQLMAALVKKMAKRLAAKYSRRRHIAHKGHLDVRKTLRRSLAYGGVPFDIQFKVKKVDKPSIVAICDVSKSVAAAAQFLLTFLYSLNEVVDRMEAFAFSGRMISVNDILDDHGVEQAIFKVLQEIGFQQTDYGRSLQDFSEQHLDKLDRRTTVIILGDGRSNFADPRLDLMREIHDRSRAVIWLNPEPESYWGQGDSVMNRYARFCHVAKQCGTIEQLERIIEDVLRSYVPH
ncbi:VWA domain-containing protein [Phenylobacterium sp.]|uniref:vWA domain-containing protein n=1 Tax=Phenylobacterium sp. TaxID=1871053 RepID=UPI0025E4F946|nr:VWA domain-containing protein [Phenylobacterium sp.]MBX3481887.1 VWA domain-containing protein [Phenylobacterium sp.]MCW5759656.1 VWA domain-containing protein [Phenylobacterium sp.]